MKRVILAVVVLTGVALTTGAKIAWNAFHDSEDDPGEVFSASAAEARRSGILISELFVAPAPGSKNGQALVVSEAWIEKCAVHRYSFVWFHHRVPTGGVTVVIKLKKPADPRFSLWPPERKASFAWIGGKYFARHFETEPQFPMALDGGTGRDLVPVLALKKPIQTAREQRAGYDLNRMCLLRSASPVVQKGSLHARPRVSHR
ncbi:MAG: hypothetical protein KDK74_13105 [Cephaloticoccus sp.]|nr:hypothetical protein [Cephaloticoccus sp.]